MSTTVETKPAPPPRQPVADERVARRSLLSRLLTRPEVGALMGAIVIYIVFFTVAPPFRDLSSLSSVLYLSSTFGIPAVAVALLMIGGEFDLSAGVAVTSSALVASMFSYEFTANMWVGVLVALVVALLIGFINGYLVVKTGIPSFLVTLGTFFMLRGLNLAITKQVTGNVGTNDVANIDGFNSAQKVFASSFTIGGVSIRITLLWWILFVAIGTWILLRTQIGNWIFAVGGSAPSSRAVGVPVNRVKIGLFMAVGFLAWFTGMHTLFQNNTVQSGIGLGNEFIYIVAAVVGGCLLTGGYGSVIGAAIGAFIFGMAQLGIVYAGWNPDWFYFFLGALLLGAILLNNYVRRRAEAMR
jgi:simple sugar transport system permease protein